MIYTFYIQDNIKKLTKKQAAIQKQDLSHISK